MQVAILTGGNNLEREISLLSAHHWKSILLDLGYQVDLFDLPTELPIFLEKRNLYSFAIPMVHGTLGEDGQLTAFLKTLEILHLFSSHEIHALCLDKWRIDRIIDILGIKTIPTHCISDIDEIQKLSLPYPIFIKPRNGGSSIDNGIYTDTKDAISLIEKILRYDEVLVQKYIEGREYTSVLLGDYSDSTLECMGIIEIQTDASFFDFHAKYESSKTREIYPARLSQKDTKMISDLTLKIGRCLRIETMARIDWIQDARGEWWFLEVNTIPGFTEMSLVPKILTAVYGSPNNWIHTYLANRFSGI